MTTPVTLSAADSSLTIGTTTQLTPGGGDGTGGYRYNNNSGSFCSINSSGVVTANYPGSCSFTVTRLATGKYLDTTSSAVTITALPEPDKSVVSTPSPEPTVTATPRVIVTATPTPSSSPAPLLSRSNSDGNSTKSDPKPTFARISSLSGTLKNSGNDLGYKLEWNSDSNAKSYSINLLGPSIKKSYSSATSSVDINSLVPGNYTMEIQAIDAHGKLSKPTALSFIVPNPKKIQLRASVSLSRPILNGNLSDSLDGFVSSITRGMPVSVNIEYTKTIKNQVAVVKLKALVEKYLKDKLVGSAVTVSLVKVTDGGNSAYIRGIGAKASGSLLIRKR